MKKTHEMESRNAVKANVKQCNRAPSARQCLYIVYANV